MEQTMFGDESEICPVTGNFCPSDGPQHSTPIKGYGPRRVFSSPIQANPKHETRLSNDHRTQWSPLTVRTLPSGDHSLLLNEGTVRPLSQTKAGEAGAKSSSLLQNTIEKQRTEIRHLIAELQDRDQELTNMVTAHQQQLLSWERDRQRLLTLEQKCHMLEEKLDQRNEDLQSVQFEQEDSRLETKATNTDINESELEEIKKEKEEQSRKVESLQALNTSLNSSLRAVSGQVGQLEAREQELVTLLRLKENDICQRSQTIEELSARVKQLSSRCQECQHREAEAVRRATRWKQKYSQTQDTLDKLLYDVKKKEEDSNQSAVMVTESQCVTIATDNQSQLLLQKSKDKNSELLCEQDKTESVQDGKEKNTINGEDRVEGGQRSRRSVDDLCRRLQKMNSRCVEFQHREADAIHHATQWKQKYLHAQETMETLWCEMKKKEEEANQSAAMVTEIQNRLLEIQQSFEATCERERWKDQLVDSLKAKQERMWDELKTVRELYERQQREVTLLQLNLDSTKESLQSSHFIDEHNSFSPQREVTEMSPDGSSMNRKWCTERGEYPVVNGTAEQSAVNTARLQRTSVSGNDSKRISSASNAKRRSSAVYRTDLNRMSCSDGIIDINRTCATSGTDINRTFSGTEFSEQGDTEFPMTSHGGDRSHAGRMSFEDKLSSFLDTDVSVVKSENSFRDSDTCLSVSPASKLQRLLTESSDLIQSLELNTIPACPDFQIENRNANRVASPVEQKSASEVFTRNRIFQNLSANSL